MGRSFRNVLAASLVPLLVVGCAQTEEVRTRPGQAVLRAGTEESSADPPRVISGRAIRRLAILVPAVDPAWEVTWSESPGRAPAGLKGAYTGFLTGLIFVQSFPLFLLTWPVAAGILAGSTAMGVLGGRLEGGKFEQFEAVDRSALLEAAANLRLDQVLRERVAERLAARTNRAPLALLWYPTRGPDTPGTDPFADARAQGADGVLDIAIEAFGLGAGDEAETYGVFLRVRARVFDPTGEMLRYERIVEYGPGRSLPGLPPPAAYTLEFLAVDQARVFRQELQDATIRMAGIVAADPALPLESR